MQWSAGKCHDLDSPFLSLSKETQSLRETYPEAAPANVNADDVIGIDDSVSMHLEVGSLKDEEILAEFSSDQEAMEEEEHIHEV